MGTEIEQLLYSLKGRVACVALALEQGRPRELLSLNPDMVFPAASLAKVPILVTLARQLAQKESACSWDTRVDVPASARVPSNGVLADLSSDLQPTLQDLAYLMITISDNTASNVLLDHVGMATVNTTMHELGLHTTRLERRFIDFAARLAGRDNWTTAAEMVQLFMLISAGGVPTHELLLKILLRQNDYGILPAYWGEEVPFAHKTGGLTGIMHDAGVLLRAHDDTRDPLIVAVLTAEQDDIPLTQFTLARVGRALRQEWLEQS